jgi:hypothetical protein
MNTKKLSFIALAAILAVIALAFCSPRFVQATQGTAQRKDAAGQASSTGKDADRTAPVTISLASRLLAKAETIRDDNIRVMAAMQANGGNRLMPGTYRLHAGSVSEYLPEPDDRMRFVLSDGTQVEMLVLAFGGNLAKGVDQFLANLYQLKVISVAPGSDNLILIAEQRDDGAVLEISGSMRLDGQEYQVYLSRQTPNASFAAGGITPGETVEGVISSEAGTFSVASVR